MKAFANFVEGLFRIQLKDQIRKYEKKIEYQV